MNNIYKCVLAILWLHSPTWQNIAITQIKLVRTSCTQPFFHTPFQNTVWTHIEVTLALPSWKHVRQTPHTPQTTSTFRKQQQRPRMKPWERWMGCSILSDRTRWIGFLHKSSNELLSPSSELSARFMTSKCLYWKPHKSPQPKSYRIWVNCFEIYIDMSFLLQCHILTKMCVSMSMSQISFTLPTADKASRVFQRHPEKHRNSWHGNKTNANNTLSVGQRLVWGSNELRRKPVSRSER